MYVPWEKCTARHMETVGDKRVELWEKDPATGFLRQRSATSDDVHAPLADHQQVDYALRRRGLALAMADLVDWQVHEKSREDLMASLARTPSAGYAKVDLGQVRRADETAFQLLARQSVHGIRRSDGNRPLDEQGLQHGVATFAGEWDPAASSSRPRSGASRSWQRCLADGTQEEGTGRAPRKGQAASSGTSSPSSDGQREVQCQGEGESRRQGQDSFSAAGLAVSWMPRQLMATIRQFALHSTSKVTAQEARQEHVVHAVGTCVSCVPAEPIMAMCPRMGANDYLTIPIEGDLEKSVKAPRGCMKIQRRSIRCSRQTFARVVSSRAESLNQACAQLILKFRRCAWN